MGRPDEIRYMICLSDPDAFQRSHVLIGQLVDHFSSLIFNILPLRERPEDILLITMQQLRLIYEQYRVERTVSPRLMSAILACDWPGNIRQLDKTINRMAFMSDNTLMDSVQLLQACLSSQSQLKQLQPAPEELPKSKTLKELVLDYEVMVINQYVEQYGSLRKAAAALDVSHSVLSNKLSRYYASSGKKRGD